MAEIEDCAKAIKNLGKGNGYKETRQLIQMTEHTMQSKKSNSKSTPIITGVPASLRAPLHTNSNTQQTRSMTTEIYRIPQLSTLSIQRVDHFTKSKHKYRPKKNKTRLHTSAPAHNTRSRTQATRPATRTRARTQSTKNKNHHKNRTSCNGRGIHSTTGKRYITRFGGHGHRYR